MFLVAAMCSLFIFSILHRIERCMIVLWPFHCHVWVLECLAVYICKKETLISTFFSYDHFCFLCFHNIFQREIWIFVSVASFFHVIPGYSFFPFR